MTEKDTHLIREAQDTDYIYWSSIEYLIEQADSEEAKSELKRIMNHKYHLEEHFAGTY